MRFDDSLDTVLSAEMSTPFGAQSTWRQLVDLIGRGRVPANAAAIARLTALRPLVPPPVRASSARALAFAKPPAALVRLFFDDEIAIAAPVLRAAQLRAADWIDMLPGMSPAARSVLRHRRDLPADVRRALESFGPVDFRLSAAAIADAAPEAVAPIAAEPPMTNAATPEEPRKAPNAPSGDSPDDRPATIEIADVAAVESPTDPVIDPIDVVAEPESSPLALRPAEPLAHDPAISSPENDEPVAAIAEVPPPEIAMPLAAEPVTALAPVEPSAPVADADAAFVPVGVVALGLPVVAEALRRAGRGGTTENPPPAPSDSSPVPGQGPFQISELVARIDAYQRQRDDVPGAPLDRGEDEQPALFDLAPVLAQAFRFETDAAGVVRWIEGAARAALIGLSLDLAVLPGVPQGHGRVDGIAGGAFRRRAGFADARLVVEGASDAAGEWRISAVPVFDRASGRFTGYRGTARRPRADESAAPLRSGASPAADALRQLVHELRTPTNAIAGFAEMIETQLLGPVPQAYREQAGTIRRQTADLLVAIDDIDLAARLESHALDLRSDVVPVGPLLVRIATDLGALAALRGADVLIDPGPPDLAIAGDERAVERLVGRLLSTLVASGGRGETVSVTATAMADAQMALVCDRPAALAAFGNEAILTIDAEDVVEADGAPLLGTGFALRLARNLAAELGGTLAIDARSLTLRLPAAVTAGVGQVSSN